MSASWWAASDSLLKDTRRRKKKWHEDSDRESSRGLHFVSQTTWSLHALRAITRNHAHVRLWSIYHRDGIINNAPRGRHWSFCGWDINESIAMRLIASSLSIKYRWYLRAHPRDIRMLSATRSHLGAARDATAKDQPRFIRWIKNLRNIAWMLLTQMCTSGLSDAVPQRSFNCLEVRVAPATFFILDSRFGCLNLELG